MTTAVDENLRRHFMEFSLKVFAHIGIFNNTEGLFVHKLCTQQNSSDVKRCTASIYTNPQEKQRKRL